MISSLVSSWSLITGVFNATGLKTVFNKASTTDTLISWPDSTSGFKLLVSESCVPLLLSSALESPFISLSEFVDISRESDVGTEDDSSAVTTFLFLPLFLGTLVSAY